MNFGAYTLQYKIAGIVIQYTSRRKIARIGDTITK